MKSYVDLTVITVSYNSARSIQETFESVRIIKQKFDFEYIVIDGGSTDSTLEIADQYKNEIDFILSEKDQGTYFAMNKGIARSSRNYVLFINSDDLLVIDGMDEVARILNELKPYLLSMAVKIRNSRGELLGIRIATLKENKKKYFGMPAHHQGLICKKNIKGELIQFNTQYRICADYDLLLRLLNFGQSFKTSSLPIAEFRQGGISASYRIRVENYNIEKNYHGGIWAISSLTYAIISKSLQSLLPSFLSEFIRRLKGSSFLAKAVK